MPKPRMEPGYMATQQGRRAYQEAVERLALEARERENARFIRQLLEDQRK